jgi:hypothetical protein
VKWNPFVLLYSILYGVNRNHLFAFYSLDGAAKGFTAEPYRHILKVPKCEIFDLMDDSREFYTIKPSWVCDFGTVIKKNRDDVMGSVTDFSPKYYTIS